MTENKTEQNVFDQIAAMIDEWGDADLDTRALKIITKHCDDKSIFEEKEMEGLAYINYLDRKFIDNSTGICAALTQDGLFIVDPQEKRVIGIFDRWVPMGSCSVGHIFQYADPTKSDYIDADKEWDGQVNKIINLFNPPTV